MTFDHMGSYRAIQSLPKSCRVKLRHTKSYRVIWSHIESHCVIQNHKEPYKVIRVRPRNTQAYRCIQSYAVQRHAESERVIKSVLVAIT